MVLVRSLATHPATERSLESRADPKCTVCGGEGLVIRTEGDGAEYACRCQCVDRRQREHLSKRQFSRRDTEGFAGAAFTRAPVAHWPIETTLALTSFVERLPEAGGIWIEGPSGEHDWAADAVAYEAGKAHFCEYGSVRGVIRQLALAQRDERYSVVRDRLLTRPLLILAGLGDTRLSAWALGELLILVDGRYEEGTALAISTKHRPSELIVQLAEVPETQEAPWFPPVTLEAEPSTEATSSAIPDDEDEEDPAWRRRVAEKIVHRLWAHCGEPLLLPGANATPLSIPTS